MARTRFQSPRNQGPVVDARDFPGMMTNVDPLDIPEGAARVQVNLTSDRPGELAVRPGAKQVAFED